MRNRALVKYLGIIVIGCVLLSCRTRLCAEEEEKAGEKVWIEVRQDEYGTTKKKYLVTKEERDRIFKMKQAIGKPLWAVEKAYRNREIDLDTKLIYKVKALEEPGSVPEKYKPIKYVKEKIESKYHQDQVKRVYREAFNKWYELKYATHKKLRPYLRGVDLEEIQADSGEIIIIGEHWDNPLVKKAYMKGEIDIDQVFLYQFGPAEEIPARFIPKRTVPLQPFEYDMQLEDVGFLPRYCKYLRPETKEKIKLYYWKERYNRRIGIMIDSPKEAVGGYSLGWIMHTRDKNGKKIVDEKRRGGLKVYTPTVKIKGKIVTPEMYPEAEAWVVVRPDGRLSFPVDGSGEIKKVQGEIKETQREIRLGPSVYEKPVLGEENKWIEEYEKKYGEEADKFVREYYAGPGKIIRRFEIELELPYYIGNVITISARNNGGQSASAGLYVTRYDRTDRKPPKVEIKKPKDGAVLDSRHYTVEGKGEEVLVLAEVTDDKGVLKVEIYCNGKFVYRAFRTPFPESEGVNTYRGGAPIEVGKNVIKVIAYDIGNNSKSDTVKIIYSPGKR